MCVAECMYGLNILIDEVIKKEIKAEIYQKFMKQIYRLEESINTHSEWVNKDK